MKRGMLIVPLLAVVLFINAQIANNWTFGYNCGLNFATNPPTFFGSTVNNRVCGFNSVQAAHNSNSISDCDGNLLFYTNGLVVWNKNHQLMPNSCLNDSLNNFGKNSSSTKILKIPNNDSLYYIFYATTRWGLRYGIINMNADNGNGNILSTHNFINFFTLTPAQQTMAPELIRHTNDSNFWLVCKPTDNDIYSYLITSQGINLIPVISSAPGLNSRFEPIKASQSGNYLFYQVNYVNGNVCNFNRSNANIYNIKTFLSSSTYPTAFAISSIEFSPNDSFIYSTMRTDANAMIRLIQFKNYSSNPGLFYTSLYSQTASGFNLTGLQLAPDGKIYITNQNLSIISCITRPDENGFGSNFVYNYIDVSPNLLTFGFPSVNFPIKRLKFNALSYTPTTCLTDSVRLYAQGDTTFLNYRWYIYDTTNTLIDSADGSNIALWLNTGPYKIKLRAKNPQCNSYIWWTDNIYVSNKPRIVAGIDSTKISCAKHSVYINYSIQFKDSVQVNWGDGIMSNWQYALGNFNKSHDYYDSSKVYSITITAKNGSCTTTVILLDTVVLKLKPKAKFHANNISTVFPIKGCTILNINLTDSSKNADSVWYIIKNTTGISYIINKVDYPMQDTGWFDIVQYTSNKDGCIDSFTVNNAVYVASKPAIQIQKDTVYKTCIQDYVRLKVNTSYNDSTLINWGDGNTNYFIGNINGTKTDTITHHFTTPGSYNIITKSKNEYCDTQASLIHLVRPHLQIDTPGIIIICKGLSANLKITAKGGDSVFTYILKSNGLVLQNATGLFTVTPDSTTTYYLGGINSCANDTVWTLTTVIVTLPLMLTVNTTDTILCKGANFQIKAVATGGNGFYFYYLKKNGITQQSNTSGNFNILTTSNETYTVEVTDNCTVLNDSKTIVIKLFNVLQFTQTPQDLYLCSGESAILKINSNNGTGTVTYEWKDATGAILSTTDSLQVNPTSTLQIFIKVTDACISIYDTVWIYQFATSSGTQLNSDVQSGCIPLTVNFETPLLTHSNAQPCEAYWDFGDGSTMIQNFNSSSTTLKQKHTYTVAGVYNVVVRVRFKNAATFCSTFTTTVEALLIPQVTLSITPKKVTLPKTQCTATISTTNADSVVINWGDGFSDNLNFSLSLITQTHDYSDTGHYTVKATAYNKNTCYVETKASVYHADTFMCFIPNVFTPNIDNLNESFKPVVSYCKSYELIIYNRWGEEVYKANYVAGKNQEAVWTGEGSQNGTYLYMLTAIDGDNLRHTYKGTVILLR